MSDLSTRRPVAESGVVISSGAPSLLAIDSTVDGSAAFLDLQGTSSADFVYVEDNDATAGNPIAMGPDSTKGANTEGWVAAALVPALATGTAACSTSSGVVPAG